VDRRNAPGSVFWDIGANVGVPTLYAASRGEVLGLRARGGELLQPRGQLRIEPPDGSYSMPAAWVRPQSQDRKPSRVAVYAARSFTFKQSKKLDAKRKSFPSIQAVQLWTIDTSRDTRRGARIT
jgi:hypothetical protein